MKVKPILKSITRIAYSVLTLVTTAIFFVFPFLNKYINPIIAQSLWYPSFAIVLVTAILPSNKLKSRTAFSYAINNSFFSSFIIFISAFIINYYETNYDWYWTTFVFFAMAIPAFVSGLISYNKHEKKPSKEQYQKALIRGINIVLLWWLFDLFYMSIFLHLTIWQFIFGGLSMVCIFYNLAFAFLSGRKSSRVGLLQDFLFGIGITVYLIYIVPDEELRTIMLAVISAVYGGLITLVGVAWTIREGQRQNRLNHLKAIKPLFYAVKYNNVDYTKDSTVRMSFRPVSNYADSDIYIIGALRNADKSDLIIDKIVIDGLELFPDYATPNVVEKNKIIEVSLLLNKSPNKESKIDLFVLDAEENLLSYSVICDFDTEYTEINRIVEVTNNE